MNEKYKDMDLRFDEAVLSMSSQVTLFPQDGARCMHMTQSIANITTAKERMQKGYKVDLEIAKLSGKHPQVRYAEIRDRLYDAILKMVSQIIASKSDGQKCLHVSQSILNVATSKRNMQDAVRVQIDMDEAAAKYSTSGLTASSTSKK